MHYSSLNLSVDIKQYYIKTVWKNSVNMLSYLFLQNAWDIPAISPLAFSSINDRLRIDMPNFAMPNLECCAIPNLQTLFGVQIFWFSICRDSIFHAIRLSKSCTVIVMFDLLNPLFCCIHWTTPPYCSFVANSMWF